MELKDLRDYISVIRNRKWIIVQTVIVMTGVTIVASILQKPDYEAEAVILFKGGNTGVSLFGQALMDANLQSGASLSTQMELIKVRPLVAKVVKKLALPLSPEALLGKVRVEAKSQTNIVTIRVQDGNPRLARDIANEIAATFISWSRESTGEGLEKVRKEIFYKRRDAEEDIVLLAEMLARNPETDSEKGDSQTQPAKTSNSQAQPTKAPNSQAQPTKAPEELKVKLGMVSSLYNVLSEKHEELRIMQALRTSGAELVSPAVTPHGPVRPRPISNGIMAFVVSLMFGLGLSFMVEYMDNTIKTPEDVELCYGLPVLGQILKRNTKDENKRDVICKISPKSQISEAYRALRTNIQYLNFDRSIRTLAVTSAVPREGKTEISANLAVALAQAGHRVIVMCCDLRRPLLHKVFGVTENWGLSDILAGRVPFEKALQDVGIDNLKFVASGLLPPNPSELLGSDRMREVLEKAKEMADFVIIDTPPALAVTDCAVLAAQVDGVMIVASCGLTRCEMARHMKSTFGNVGARLLGVVLNRIQVHKQHDYYYYGYYYGNYSRQRGAS